MIKTKKRTIKSLVKSCDKLMSQIIRSKGKCDKCGATNRVFHWAHVTGRRNRTLRWDENNAMCLCYPCHNWWHENPLESGKWFREKYPERADYLGSKKNLLTKRTLKDYLELEKELKTKLQGI